MKDTDLKNIKTFSKRTVSDKMGKGLEIFLLVLLIVYCISIAIPLIWMILTSLKTFDDYLLNPFGLPKQWKFSNYVLMLSKFKVEYTTKVGNVVYYKIDAMAIYSLLWTFGRTFVHVVITSMVAYCIAKFNFFGRNFIFNLGIIIMIIPIIGSTPSLMQMRRDMGIYNNMTLLLLTAEATAFSGLHFLLLHASFKRVPQAYSEAAKIDGANNYTVFFRVVMPMVIPTCVAIFVLQFLAIWSDYSTFIMWMPSYPSLSVGMYLFEQQASKYGATMPEILTVFVLVIIPTTFLYLLTHKIIMSKFTVGGLKG